MKYVVIVLAGGLSFWALEKYSMKDSKFLGQFAFEEDAAGAPKLGVGYFAYGAAIVGAALLVGAAAHKISGGRIAKGLATAGK
jgi:hypothetical protein